MEKQTIKSAHPDLGYTVSRRQNKNGRWENHLVVNGKAKPVKNWCRAYGRPYVTIKKKLAARVPLSELFIKRGAGGRPAAAQHLRSGLSMLPVPGKPAKIQPHKPVK